jgi:trimeric autotransporter adhesin
VLTFAGGLVATAPSSISLGGTVNTTNTAMTLGDSGTPVVLNADATLNAGSGYLTLGGAVYGTHALALNSTGITTLVGAVGGNGQALSSLNTNPGGSLVINGGSVNTSGVQTYGETTAVSLGTDTTLTASMLTFNAPVTGAGYLHVVGASTLHGGGITTTGAQTYSGPVTLTADMVFDAGTEDVSFASTVDGAYNMRVSTAGLTTFSGAVGTGQALASLTVDSDGMTQISGYTVTTTGAQTFDDMVSLAHNTTLTASQVTFNAPVSGAGSLRVVGDATFHGGFITTTGAQRYSGAVVLASDTTLNTSGSAPVSFDDVVDGPFNLTVNSAGATTFLGAVGSTTPLMSLTTNASGTLVINGGSVATTGVQNYGETSSVTLGGDTTLTASMVTFNAPVSGLAGFLRVVGDTTLHGGHITTSGEQSFSGAVTLSANTVLDAGGSDVSLSSTVDGAYSLEIRSTGVTTLGGAVGATYALTSLSTNTGGSLVLSGGSVITTGSQSYGEAVTLGVDTVLSSTNSGAISLPPPWMVRLV